MEVKQEHDDSFDEEKLETKEVSLVSVSSVKLEVKTELACDEFELSNTVKDFNVDSDLYRIKIETGNADSTIPREYDIVVKKERSLSHNFNQNVCVRSKRHLRKRIQKNKANGKKKLLPYLGIRKCFISTRQGKKNYKLFVSNILICYVCGKCYTTNYEFLNRCLNHVVHRRFLLHKYERDPIDGKTKGNSGKSTRFQNLLPPTDLDLVKEEIELVYNNLKIETELQKTSSKELAPFDCVIGSEKYVREPNLIGHKGEKPFTCEICLKQFTRKNRLNDHFRCHTGEKPFNCDVCLKQFAAKSNLQRHIVSHATVKPFKCEICSKEFRRKDSLLSHLRCHTGEKPFQCEICLKQFSKKCNLQCHKISHTDEKPFKCEICSKKIRTAQCLEIHLLMHSGDKPFKCEVCSKRFTTTKCLKTHLRIHSGEKQFKCEICSKEFTQKGNLQVHLRCHTGEKPFKCEICSKSFTTAHYLAIHLRLHSGDKPFKCEICSKRFAAEKCLKIHLRIHSEEKQFKCEFCSKHFAQKGNLQLHLRSHIPPRITM